MLLRKVCHYMIWFFPRSFLYTVSGTYPSADSKRTFLVTTFYYKTHFFPLSFACYMIT